MQTCISRATMAFLISLLVITILQSEHTVIFSSFAASIFLIVAMPNSDAAQIKNVVGGHILGLISGGIIAGVMSYYVTDTILTYAVSVGLATLFMSICELLHPPAAGTALGVVMTGFSLNAVISIITSICILYMVMYLIQNNIFHYIKK